jgi:uncharacterized protein YbaR (Trm112 family)
VTPPKPIRVVMKLDKRLLDLLCCPVSHAPLIPLTQRQLQALNQGIAAGEVKTVAGAPVSIALAAGLITNDGKVIYRIDDGIPVMLPEEGIGTTQFTDFPRP